MSLESQNFLVDPYTLRSWASCFNLIVPLGDCDAAIEEAVKNSHQIESQVNATLQGNFSFWDYLEAVEPYVLDMDDYLLEVEENLAQQIQIYRN